MSRVLIVFVAGGVGSVLRYAVSLALNERASWPLATFSVNVAGCFLMGLALGLWAVWDAGSASPAPAAGVSGTEGDAISDAASVPGSIGSVHAAAGLFASGWGASGIRLAVATGLLGGFTTFSAFAGETVRLASQRSAFAAGAYALGTNAACLVACGAGLMIARALASR